MRRSSLFLPAIALGIIIILVGLIIGTSSNTVDYSHVVQQSIEHYLSDGTTGIVKLKNNATLYIVEEKNFSPALSSIANGSLPFFDGETISLAYLPDQTQAIDVTSTSGTHLVGTAYIVVQITIYDNAGAPHTFHTPTYTQHPHAIDNNYWNAAIVTLLIGLLFITGAFFLPRRAPLGPHIHSSDRPLNQHSACWLDRSYTISLHTILHSACTICTHHTTDNSRPTHSPHTTHTTNRTTDHPNKADRTI